MDPIINLRSPFDPSFVVPRAASDPNVVAVVQLDNYPPAGDLPLATIRRLTFTKGMGRWISYHVHWRTPEHGWLPTDPGDFCMGTRHPTVNDAARFIAEQVRLYCQLFLPA